LLVQRTDAIQKLLHPRSIAVIGASADLSKINGRPLRNLLEKGYAGNIYPVNPKYSEIAGLVCYPSVQALPIAVDMAIVAVAAKEVVSTVRALGEKGVSSAVVFSSGFREMGAQGAALEQELKATAEKAGVVLCGPNCLGFINAFENVYATFSQYADGETGAGPVAFVTQSGAFGTAIAALIRERGLGLGYFINTGNQADLNFTELMSAVIEDPRIKVAAGYLEGLDNGDQLVALARKCQQIGKPLVLTKVGRMSSGAKAAASHTGALAVSDAVFDAVIRQYGVLRARNEEQMLDMLEALSQPRRANGFGLGIVTQSGGAGVMMADRAEEMGLTVPEVSQDTQKKLFEIMPAFGAAANPVDITGQFVADPGLLIDSVVTLLNDSQIDIAIVWIQLMHAHVDKLVAIFERVQAATSKPLFICWVAAPAAAVKRLRAMGIAVFGAGERAVEAAAALASYQAHVRRFGADADSVSEEGVHVEPVHYGVQPTVEASERLREAGIPMARVLLATTAQEAIACWKSLGGGPLALKIESPDITHKTEVGGVALGLSTPQDIAEAFARLIANARAAAPAAQVQGVILQPMTQGHVELVVGVRRDPVFGMIVMVGIGGILVEVLRDVVFRKAPFSQEEGLRMLDELRMRALLDGVRGKPAIDRRAIARLLADLSKWAYAMRSVLDELDLNPVLVGEGGPTAVDCVMVFAKE
jgi:acetate---CoA ligase (ADP-forming)